MKVSQCSRCGGDHEDVEPKLLEQPPGPVGKLRSAASADHRTGCSGIGESAARVPCRP